MKKFAFYLLTILFLIIFGSMTQTSAETYDLPQLENMLWGSNDSVEAAYWRLEAAFDEQEEASYLWLPHLTLSSSYSEVYASSFYYYSKYSSYVESASLNFPLSRGLFNRHFTVMERKEKSREKQGELSVIKNQTLYDLRRGFILASSSRRLADLYDQGLIELKKILREIEAQKDNKQNLKSNTLLAEKHLLRFQSLKNMEINNYLREKAEIAALTGLKSLSFELSLNHCELPDFPPEQALIDLALKNNPLFEILRARQEAEGFRAGGAYFENIDMRLIGGYALEQARYSSGSAEGGFIGLNLTLPLSYFQVSSLRKHEALSREKSFRAELRYASAQLKNQISAAYNEINRLREDYEYLSKEKEEAQFRRGQFNVRNLYSEEIDYAKVIQAEIDFWEAQAALEKKNTERSNKIYQLICLSGKFNLNSSVEPSNADIINAENRMLILDNPSILSDARELDFLLLFCQSKGIRRVLLPQNFLSGDNRFIIAALAKNNIESWLCLSSPADSAQSVREVIAHNEKNDWPLNLKGIFLKSGSLEGKDFSSNIMILKKMIYESGQDIKLIPLLPADSASLENFIENAGEIALPGLDAPSPDLDLVIGKKNIGCWRVLELRGYCGKNEQDLESDIQKIKDDKQIMGVILDNYSEYRKILIN